MAKWDYSAASDSARRFANLAEAAALLDYAMALVDEAGQGSLAGGLLHESMEAWALAEQTAEGLTAEDVRVLLDALEAGELGGDMDDQAAEILRARGMDVAL
ncbi:MAG: hypothetical protein LBG60_10845 [Bifidobacteriaceae bacterium]|jgi:hypothetical protein|nr:hypothetical protein [Bifidobacteriaceae bacterium]